MADVKEHVSKEYLSDENKDFILIVFGPTKEHCQITINGKDAEVISTRSRIGFPVTKYEDGHWVKTFNNKESREKGIFDIIIKLKIHWNMELIN